MASLFGEEKKGSVIKYTLQKTISASSIVSCDLFDNIGAQAFLVDFSAVNNERFAIMPCFGDKTYIFAYGHDMGTSRSTVTLLLFLEGCGEAGKGSAFFKKALNTYASKRVSKSGSKISLSILGSSGLSSGFLISMQVKAYNPSLNALTVSATLMTLPPGV